APHRAAAGAGRGVEGQNDHWYTLRSIGLQSHHSSPPRTVTPSSSPPTPSTPQTPAIPLPAITGATTPAMRQYLDAKRQYRDALLFFRMGDFYEMFYEDAVTAARALELTLTSRSKDSGGSPIPMCGVPFHAGDTYIARLVKRGFRVAICDQVENPKNAK